MSFFTGSRKEYSHDDYIRKRGLQPRRPSDARQQQQPQQQHHQAATADPSAEQAGKSVEWVLVEPRTFILQAARGPVAKDKKVQTSTTNPSDRH
ncbi:hypothetical protein HDE_10748 [Halotydeus destructor]|nr:hypothetical protein HDE_10748 [Halotydeus destructor]